MIPSWEQAHEDPLASLGESQQRAIPAYGDCSDDIFDSEEKAWRRGKPEGGGGFRLVSRTDPSPQRRRVGFGQPCDKPTL